MRNCTQTLRHLHHQSTSSPYQNITLVNLVSNCAPVTDNENFIKQYAVALTTSNVVIERPIIYLLEGIELKVSRSYSRPRELQNIYFQTELSP